MRYTFIGKNVTITDGMKDRITSKLSRLEKLLSEDTEIFVTVKVVKSDQTVEITIPMNRRILRAEVTENDAYVAIDEIVDILEKQIIKYKGRLRDRSKKDLKYRDELGIIAESEGVVYSEEEGIKIEKTKKFALKPMDAEEAVMEMELLNHNFYMFKNSETEEINVVYKRKNAGYGIIEPEF